MKRWARLLVLVAGAATIAIGVEIAQPGSRWASLAIIGGAIAAGELIELRPPLRAALPISFAFMVVLARQASVQDAILVLVGAELATFLVRSEPTSVEGRLALFAERLLEGLAAVLVYHGMADALGAPPTRAKVLFALAVAALAPIAVAEVARMLRDKHFGMSAHGRMADVALVTSATLMAISDLGVAGHGGMGLWGPAVFTIPLLAAWYSYEHLESIRRTYDQTIRALGAAPELGRMVRDGHAERVADLTVAMGSSLGFLAPRARPARDRGAAAPPRTGLSRRAGRRPSAGAGVGCAGRRHHSSRARSSSRRRATSSPRSGCRTASTSARVRR